MTATRAIAAQIADAVLVEAARRGDLFAWERLVRRYQEPVYRVAFLIVRDTALAEAATQSTFVRAYRALPSLEDDVGLLPWLFRIAAGEARQQRRESGRPRHSSRPVGAHHRPALPGERGAGARGCGDPQPTERELVGEAFDRLGEEDRLTLASRYLFGLSRDGCRQARSPSRGRIDDHLQTALQRPAHAHGGRLMAAPTVGRPRGARATTSWATSPSPSSSPSCAGRRTWRRRSWTASRGMRVAYPEQFDRRAAPAGAAARPRHRRSRRSVGPSVGSSSSPSSSCSSPRSCSWPPRRTPPRGAPTPWPVTSTCPVEACSSSWRPPDAHRSTSQVPRCVAAALAGLSAVTMLLAGPRPRRRRPVAGSGRQPPGRGRRASASALPAAGVRRGCRPAVGRSTRRPATPHEPLRRRARDARLHHRRRHRLVLPLHRRAQRHRARRDPTASCAASPSSTSAPS